jgi:hypothetical protein
MPQVLNRSKNASTLINNVEFTKTAKGMISEDIPQELVDYFLKMPNYVAVKAAPQPKTQPAQETTPQDDPAANAAAEAAAAAERQAAEEAAAAEAAKQQQA